MLARASSKFIGLESVKTANIKEIPAERELFCSFGGRLGQSNTTHLSQNLQVYFNATNALRAMQ
jgi:hypothetical protein